VKGRIHFRLRAGSSTDSHELLQSNADLIGRVFLKKCRPGPSPRVDSPGPAEVTRASGERWLGITRISNLGIGLWESQLPYPSTISVTSAGSPSIRNLSRPRERRQPCLPFKIRRPIRRHSCSLSCRITLRGSTASTKKVLVEDHVFACGERRARKILAASPKSPPRGPARSPPCRR